VAGGQHPVRTHVVPELPVGEPDARVAVVAGVQGPRGGRRQVADVAAPETVAGRQGAGRDPEQPGRRQQRVLVRAHAPGLRRARRLETVPDPGVLLRAAGGQRHIHNTVLRRKLFPSGRLDGGQQRGVDRGRRAPAGHERHRVRVHTAREPPDDGHGVGRPDGRVDGRVRRVRVGVRAAAGGRQAVRLGAAGVHPVQRERQHAGNGAAAVDDDRRAVPAQGPRHNGRPGAVAGLLLHIRHGENVAEPDDRAGHRPDHVAVRGRRRGRRVLRGRVPAGDPGQDAAPDREAVQQRRPRRHAQGRRGVRGKEEVQARRSGHRGVHHQFVGGRVSQTAAGATAAGHIGAPLSPRVVKTYSAYMMMMMIYIYTLIKTISPVPTYIYRRGLTGN